MRLKLIIMGAYAGGGGGGGGGEEVFYYRYSDLIKAFMTSL